MKNSKLVLAGAALAFMVAGVGSAFAQATDAPPKKKIMNVHGHAARTDMANESGGYRPLTVGGARRRPTGPVEGAAAAVAAPVDFGLGVAGGAVTGAAGLVAAPLNGLFGGPVGISNDLAPPLPIKARYARTGAVASTVAEGYSQDVPVDKSGPIYMIDNGGNDRRITPFTLLAFPLVAATSAVTTPLRPATP